MIIICSCLCHAASVVSVPATMPLAPVAGGWTPPPRPAPLPPPPPLPYSMPLRAGRQSPGLLSQRHGATQGAPVFSISTPPWFRVAFLRFCPWSSPIVSPRSQLSAHSSSSVDLSKLSAAVVRRHWSYPSRTRRRSSDSGSEDACRHFGESSACAAIV